MATKALKRKKLYLCLFGPFAGQWKNMDEAQMAGYKAYNRAHSFGEPRKLSAILIHNETLQVQGGLKW